MNLTNKPEIPPDSDGEAKRVVEERHFQADHHGNEARRIRTEEQFRLLIESVAEYAIFLLDTLGYIVTWNAGAERLKGYRADEIIGKHFSIFYTADDVQRGHPLDELAIAAAEGRYEEEGWRVRKDGTQFWANVLITALRDPEGILCGYGKVTRDFTDRRDAENARLVRMREQISRSFLRDILFSVTEGRLRFCEDKSQLPQRLSCKVEETEFSRSRLRLVRKDVASMASAIGMPERRILDLVTAASEAAMNALVHARRSRYAVCASATTMQVWITDTGTGIELSQLHRATLERGFTTQNSLGHGFWLILNTCDRLWLHSTPQGTIVVLEQDVEPPEPDWLARPRDRQDYQTGPSGDPD